jgi:hypothetical protein
MVVIGCLGAKASTRFVVLHLTGWHKLGKVMNVSKALLGLDDIALT